MSNFLFKFLILFLCSSCCLPLSGCGKQSAQQRIASHFSAQETVSCDIQSNIVFSSQSADSAESQLSCKISATAQSHLISNFFHLDGTIEKTLDTLDLGTTEIESFYDPQYDQSYSRFGSKYSVTGASSGLGSLVKLPSELQLDQNYTLQTESELINGSICDVYVGTELSEHVDIPVYAFGSHASFSLGDIPIQVRLATVQGTSLPAQMSLTYSPEGRNCSFTLPDGTEYTLSELTFEVTYHHYGQPIDTAVPDGFREQALASEHASSAETPKQPETAPPQSKDFYYIETPNRSCRYQIFTPEYMAPEAISDSSASFYYFYSETDFEIIEYNLWEDFSPQDAAAYIEALPQLLRQSDAYGNLTASKVNTIAIDDREVQYRTIHFQTVDNDLLYDGILVYSWCLAPNEKDVLEVVLWEYNGSDNSSMIQPEEELCFAYHYAKPANER